MWMYTDIYKAIIKYIDTDLCNTDYVLNFGIVAIATQSPQASIKFCLKNIQTNKTKTLDSHSYRQYYFSPRGRFKSLNGCTFGNVLEKRSYGVLRTS